MRKVLHNFFIFLYNSHISDSPGKKCNWGGCVKDVTYLESYVTLPFMELSTFVLL